MLEEKCGFIRVLKFCTSARIASGKKFLRDNGIAPFAIVDSLEDLEAVAFEIGRPSVLKTAAFGYDGKGQLKMGNEDADTESIWNRFWQASGRARGLDGFQHGDLRYGRC